MTQDEKYMREAIRQAKKAYALGEVPIGCVIVYQDKIIGRDIIGEILIKIRSLTRRSQRSTKRAKN